MSEPEQTEPTEVEEVSPLEMIETLEEIVKVAQMGLRRIRRINPALFPGGPSNQNFGKRFQQAFEASQKGAAETLKEMEELV